MLEFYVQLLHSKCNTCNRYCCYHFSVDVNVISLRHHLHLVVVVVVAVAIAVVVVVVVNWLSLIIVVIAIVDSVTNLVSGEKGS